MGYYFDDIKDDVRFVILREFEDASFDDCEDLFDVRKTILDSVVECAQHFGSDEIVEYVSRVIVDPRERNEAGLSFDDFDDCMSVFEIYEVVVKAAFDNIFGTVLVDFLKGARND